MMQWRDNALKVTYTRSIHHRRRMSIWKISLRSPFCMHLISLQVTWIQTIEITLTEALLMRLLFSITKIWNEFIHWYYFTYWWCVKLAIELINNFHWNRDVWCNFISMKVFVRSTHKKISKSEITIPLANKQTRHGICIQLRVIMLCCELI